MAILTDTYRKHVLPKLYAAGWDDDQITQQKTFTDGRIIVGASKPRHGKQKRARGGGTGGVYKKSLEMRHFRVFTYPEEP